MDHHQENLVRLLAKYRGAVVTVEGQSGREFPAIDLRSDGFVKILVPRGWRWVSWRDVNGTRQVSPRDLATWPELEGIVRFFSCGRDESLGEAIRRRLNFIRDVEDVKFNPHLKDIGYPHEVDATLLWCCELDDEDRADRGVRGLVSEGIVNGVAPSRQVDAFLRRIGS